MPISPNATADASADACWRNTTTAFSADPTMALGATTPPAPAASSLQGVVPSQAQAKGVYLQLGAFTVRENAELFRARMMREFAWLSETIQVIAGESLFRLHLGPYRTSEEARAIAERIRAQVSLSPLLVVR